MKVDYTQLANRFEDYFIEEHFIAFRPNISKVTVTMPEVYLWFKYREEYNLNTTKVKKELLNELKERGWDIQSGLITKSI